MNKTPLAILLAAAGLATIVTGTATVSADPPPPTELGLLQLREDFHLAGSIGDSELMRSLWTEDAVFNGAGMTIEGVDDIVAFFESGANWGTSISLTSESKTELDATGNTAMYAFECIIVRVNGSDPLATSLSSLPPGSQNPDVEIVQHSNTTGVAVREDGRWKFHSFNGSGGPL